MSFIIKWISAIIERRKFIGVPGYCFRCGRPCEEDELGYDNGDECLTCAGMRQW